MEGFHIGKKGSYIDEVTVTDKYRIGLLSSGDGVEVLQQNIQEGRLFYIYPPDKKNIHEFYYILSGEIECEIDGQKIVLGAQDYFTAKNIREPVHFTVLTDVALLSLSTEPTFFHVSENGSNLINVVEQVEQKDRYTYKHSDRVANYSVKIARKLKITRTEQLEKLTKSSFLHDIGKIHVPEEILNKPGRLTDEEYAIIKKHPGDGAEMVRGTYYDHLYDIIDQHHERLDGSGYPHGLKGDEIVLEAKIIAVSDTFDAMTEDRAYRKAFTPQYAMDELKRLAGVQYDRDIVDAFEQVLKDDGMIK